MISRGDIYWLHADGPDGQPAPYAHPHVVVQDDLFNHSRVHTVIVCGLTTNVKTASEPGNVLLDPGEATLPKQSVVVVSHVSSVEKSRLGERIGTLSRERIEQILDGLRFVQGTFQR